MMGARVPGGRDVDFGWVIEKIFGKKVLILSGGDSVIFTYMRIEEIS